MNEVDFNVLIGRLPRAQRRVYEAIVSLAAAQPKGVAVADLRNGAPGTALKGRSGGMTKEINALRAAGLVRAVGTRPAPPPFGTSLVVLPTGPREVAAAVEQYGRESLGGVSRKPMPAWQDPVVEIRSRLRYYKVREEPSFDGYWKTRRRIADITTALIDFAEMTFWEVTRLEGDTDRAREDLLALAAVVDRALEALDQRDVEAKVEARIEATMNTNGRGEIEMAGVRAARRRLRARLAKLRKERVTA